MKDWIITLRVAVPDEVGKEHVESGTREAMEALDYWQVQDVEAVESAA